MFSPRRASSARTLAATGIHRVTVGRGLSGQRPFTVDELELVAEALDVEIDWLLTGYVEPNRPVPPAGFEPAAFRSEEPLLFPQDGPPADQAEEHDWDAEVIPIRPTAPADSPASTVVTI
jgi:transcriptional regulator with XRE-family HTH domain